MKRTTALLAATTIAAGVILGVAAGPAQAETLVAQAQDQTVATAPLPRTQLVGVDYIPAGLKVSGHEGKPVTVSAKGLKPRTVKPKDRTIPVTFSKLTPGSSYRIQIDGKTVATATVLATPGRASGMEVHLRDGDPGSVLITWAYTPAKNTGSVAFRLTATPIVGQSDQNAVTMDVPGSERQAILSGLNPHTLYKFSVAATNPAAVGSASTAPMTRTLGDLTGADDAAAKAAADNARRAADDAARKAAESTPPAGGTSGGSSGPTTRTIWVCPDGFEEAAGQCQTTRAYTFHTETQTQAYTYTWTQTGTRRNTDNQTCGYLPDANGNPVVECWGAYDEPVYSNVKNATPSGWTDNGSAWVRDVQVKDSAPAGYTDSGSAWVKTAPKVERTVPA